jgi:DUF971 family protein
MANPIELRRLGIGEVEVVWDDGQVTQHSARSLRGICPCATCREKRSKSSTPDLSKGLPVLSLAETKPLEIVRMQPVGNYAYNIAFSDGHDSGIFQFAFLRELGGISTTGPQRKQGDPS